MSGIKEVKADGKEELQEEKTVSITASEAKSILSIFQLSLKADGSINAVPAISYFQNKFGPLFQQA